MGCVTTEFPSLDDQLEAVSNAQRRRLLISLLPEDRSDGTSESADGPRADAVEPPREPDMVHNHLPKLARIEVIDWDRQNHRVTRGPEFETIRPFLELLDDHGVRAD